MVDNADPNRMGRVQVEVPGVAPDQPLGWPMPCVPFAGHGVGLYLIPAVDTLVWIELEGGDLRLPIWSGCFWVADQLPQGAEPGVFIVFSGVTHPQLASIRPDYARKIFLLLAVSLRSIGSALQSHTDLVVENMSHMF